MGRFSLEREVANYGDIVLVRRGLLKPAKFGGRPYTGCRGFCSGALCSPTNRCQAAGATGDRKVRVKYADGRATRAAAQGAYVKILERDSAFTAVVEPKRDTVLIGAIVLEDLDLLVDCQHQRLIPRDPHGAIYEIE